ncbi:unnamed protein product [Adineta steineri]|uniref:Uncharacterized protein n=1 Tax=Adineta steineri TaxID=433720 RepID=A0A819I9U9_9BILA|nr:unnamed protein product [Adineta steineri]
MDYSHERRHRHRRRYHSPSSSSFDISSSRDDDDIEQEIIDRAIEIERSREKSLRRQFEYIVDNIKKLERRRYHHHRTRSPTYHERFTSPSRHRTSDSHSYRNSSTEPFHQTNDSSYSETRTRSPLKLNKLISCPITMIYQGIGSERHGDEIMVLQENIIVFKGFLRPKEPFTFKFKRHHRQLIVKLEFFINELFECRLSIDCEREQLNEENDLFQLQHMNTFKTNDRRQTDNEQQRTTKIDKSTSVAYSRRHRHNQTSNSSIINEEKRSTLDNQRSHQKSVPDDRRRLPTRENSSVKQRSHRSPSPVKLPSRKQNESKQQQQLTNKTDKSKSDSIETRSTKSKTISNNEEKPILRPLNSSDNEDKILVRKQNYGPPQVSTFTRSDSESVSEELLTTTVQQNNEKSPSEIVKQTESSSTKKDDDDEEEEVEEENGGSGNMLGFLQLLQAMSGGSLRVPSTNDDGDGIQGLLARLGIVTQTNTRKKLTLTRRQIGNVEDFLLVYLDSSAPDHSLTIKLRGLINYLKIFDDADDCIAFINTISNEKVIIIVSDVLGHPVVSRIQDLQQLFAIYVLCQTEEEADSWSTNQPKIRGVYTHISEILEQIKMDMENDEENSLTFTHILPTTNIKEEPFFIINQIVKEIIIDSDDMNEAKKELIDFCQNEYKDNEEQLISIEQFQDKYQKENVLEFYQKQFFLYKMLNKGFRIPDVDILFKLRLFIQNLHNFILSSSNDVSIKTIYRLQILTNDELEILKKCSDNGYISFSHFFFATTNRPEQNLSSFKTNNNEYEEILFEIDVTNSNHYMSIDNQILVTFGLVTRVANIEKDKHGKTIVHLTTINSDDRQYENLIEPIRKETRAPHPSLRIVKLFIELEQYSHAVHLGQILLADLINAKKDPLLALARVYHSLGTALYEKEEYDDALEIIKKSHELYLRFLPDDASQLSPTWNNMGSIYLRQGNTELALEYHQKALSIQLKSPSPDLPSIISYSNNIGGVYLKLERYDDALVHFRRALQIEEQTLPTNHPELAGSYHRIGGVYFRQNNYEKALEFYNKTLDIELAVLPDNHPTVAVTYHNRGTAFEGLGRLEEAVESAEKAVERLLKTLQKNHPQVQMNQAYVDRLKQKLWVKQLFSS